MLQLQYRRSKSIFPLKLIFRAYNVNLEISSKGSCFQEKGVLQSRDTLPLRIQSWVKSTVTNQFLFDVAIV